MADLCDTCMKPLNDFQRAGDLDEGVFCSERCQEKFDAKREVEEEKEIKELTKLNKARLKEHLREISKK